jgi:hypothetical protein
MSPVLQKQPAALQTYTTEYASAFDRTESLGLQVPRRVLVKKPCVDPDRTLPVLLDYFDRHTPEELRGQTLATNADLIALANLPQSPIPPGRDRQLRQPLPPLQRGPTGS